MNVQEVADRVKRIFGDEAGVQVTDQDIIRWVNDAQNQIAVDNTGLMETTGNADIVANQAVYDFPVDLSVLRSLAYSGYRLRSMSFSEFNEYIDGFKSPDANFGTGKPEVFMVWDNQITLFPTPGSDLASGLTIYYVKQPTIVTNLADSLTVPIQYHNSVVDYCLRFAYELDEDYEKANYKKSNFDETMMKLNNREKWTSREYYPTITTLPEDAEYGWW